MSSVEGEGGLLLIVSPWDEKVSSEGGEDSVFVVGGEHIVWLCSLMRTKAYGLGVVTTLHRHLSVQHCHVITPSFRTRLRLNFAPSTSMPSFPYLFV